MQDLIYEFVRDELPVLAAEVLFFQIVCDGLRFIALRVLSEYLADDFGFRLVDVILLVLQVPSEDISSARGIAFEPALPQTAVDFLFEVFGEVFVEAFDDGKKQLAFRRIGDVLHRGDQLHAAVGQFLSVDDRFVLVAGKPV